MSKALIALAALAMGAIAADSPAVDPGGKFEAPDDVADKLIADGQAKLDASAPAPKAVRRVKARLLVDSALGNTNDLVELEPGQVKQVEADGIADTSKEAVAYAMTLEQNKPAKA